MNGAQMIAAERERHPEKGWTEKHDLGHPSMTLAMAGVAYVIDIAGIHSELPEYMKQALCGHAGDLWPFGADEFKPTHNDPVRQLVKAGSFIAAEIDRFLASRRERNKNRDLVSNTSDDSFWVDCRNDRCRWPGLSEDCVHPRHEPAELLCPDCCDVVEPCDIL